MEGSIALEKLSDRECSGGALEIPAQLEAVGPARQKFGRFLRAAGLSAKDAAEHWDLVFTEAVVNGIRHGSAGQREARLGLRWWTDGEWIFLEVEDGGKGPAEELRQRAQLPEDQLQEGGRGLFLMRSFCDRVEHWTGSGGHRVLLGKRHGGLTVNPILEQTLEELSASYESLSAFYRLGTALIRSDRVSAFLDGALQDLRTLVPSDRQFIGWRDGLQPVLAEELATVSNMVTWNQTGVARECAEGVLERGREVVWENSAETRGYGPLEGYAAGCSLPIRAADRTIGFLGVGRRAGGRPLTAKEVSTIRTFADLFGIAVAHADSIILRGREQEALREIEIAAQLQETLVPARMPPPSGRWEMFLRRQVARSVSGDYAEGIALPDGGLLVAVMDVMGKGIPAAFLAAMLRTALRIHLDLAGRPDELAEKLNALLGGLLGDLSLFATCALVRIEADLSACEVINAGHCPVLLFQSGGDLVEVNPSGPPLGVLADISYGVTRLELRPGDTVLVVTDGLFEWPLPSGEIFGWQRFRGLARSQVKLGPESMWTHLREAIGRGGPDSGFDDDQTMLYWKRKS